MMESIKEFVTSFGDPTLLLYAAPVIVAVLYFLVSAIGQSGE